MKIKRTVLTIDQFNSGTCSVTSVSKNVIKSKDMNLYTDFFVEDVEGFISENNLDIKDYVYIVNFDTKIVDTDNITKLKDIYIDTLTQFIEKNENKFIIARIGYNDSEKDMVVRNLNETLFIEKYVALNEAGFVNINVLTGFEYSQTFVYRNDIAKKFLEEIFRLEATNFI